MESKYIDLVINRLTQAQYDDLKRNNKISEEELYIITDHDDLFYYRTQLYTKDELDTKLSNLKSLVASTYATKKELEDFSPVEANPSVEETAPVLETVEIDGIGYKVFPEGSVEFSTEKSTSEDALTLYSIKVGSDIWNLPISSTDIGEPTVDLTNYYTKAETGTLLNQKQDKLTSGTNIKTVNGQSLLGSGNIKIEIPEADLTGYATEAWVESKGYLTQHQDLSLYAKKTELFSKDYNELINKPTIPSIAGLASETYVNTKISDLVGSAPETLNTIQEIASALENQDDVITALETNIGKKADSSALSALETKLNNKVDSLDVYTKEEIDNMDFSEVSANPELAGGETILKSVSIAGQNYSVMGNTLSLSNVAVNGAYNLRSITINGDSWNIVGTATGGGSSGDISADLQDYYTKAETEQVVADSITSIINGAPDTYNTFKEIADYIESDLSNSAAMLASINSKANKSEVYTQAEANAKFLAKSDVPEIPDMSDYYTKSETEQVIDNKIGSVTGLDNYYNKGEIDSKVETINANKQNTLVSGTNIKTINGESLLGSGNITITGGSGGSGGGSTVIANPELDGTEDYLESIQIEDTKYSLFGSDFTLSEAPVEGATPLKNIKINDDNWSVETGSHVSANIELSGEEQYLESIEIDSVKYSVKGEEMTFSESEESGATILRNIKIGEDSWSTGYAELLAKIAELEARIEALEGGN